MNRALRRAAPIALASAAALILVGCAGSGTPSEPTETAAAAECMDVASGSLSDGVTVEGEFAEKPTATFETPVEADALERTVAIEGDGDETVAGDPVNVVVTAYSGTSGDEVFSQPATITAGDEGIFEAFRASIDCVPVGSRTVTVAPAETLYGETGNEAIGIAPGESVVIVVDLVEVQEPLDARRVDRERARRRVRCRGRAAHGHHSRHRAADRAAVEGARRGRRRHDRRRRQRDPRLPGHQLGHRRGLRPELTAAASPRRFTTEGVIQGFGAALVGQKVGTKLIVSIPPEYAYGTDPAAHDLGGQTLVFLVEIVDTAPPAQ